MIIWIASYPRSGNTFLRVILKSVFGLGTYSVYNDILDIAKDPATSEVVGHKLLPENFDLDEARKSEELFLIKTHEILEDSSEKVIYLFRDGRQNALSYLNYLNTFHDQPFSIRDVIYGNVFFGSWGDHIDQWNPKARENTLLLKFEDLVVSPRAYLKQISDFIGCKKISAEIPDFQSLHKINPAFFRQGKTDTWRSELKKDEINSFWLNNLEQMQELYPEARPPELLQDKVKSFELSTLFREQGRYFNSSISDLRSQVAEYKKGSISSEQKISNLEQKNSNLEQKNSNLEQKNSNLEQKNSNLESHLRDKTEKLQAIRMAIAELINVKFIRSPILKFHTYKNMVKIFFETGK